MNRYFLAAALAVTALLTACGGGGSSVADAPLPIDEANPKAYTTAYLDAHPEALIQPEHLLVVDLDPQAPGGIVTARLYVPQARELSLGISDTQAMLSSVEILDADGRVLLSHQRGQPAVTATLGPGANRIVFHIAPGSGTDHQTVFLKLADTPADAARRAALQPAPGLLGAAPVGATGSVDSNCQNCNFNGVDLSQQGLIFNVNLSGSTFLGANITGAYFRQVNCSGCNFSQLQTAVSGAAARFFGSTLTKATLQGNWNGSSFYSTALDGAVFNGSCLQCQWLNVPGLNPTTMTSMDLTQAVFDSAYGFQNIDFSSSTVSAGTFVPFAPRPPGTIPEGQVFVGAKFDHVQGPLLASYDIAGHDFSGTSFAGVDLHAFDFSVANGVTISGTTGLSQAILSDGTKGINLAGQVFPAQYSGFAGTASDPQSGKQMSGVTLDGATLIAADLTRVILRGAYLHGTVLTNANLYGADLRGAQGGASATDKTVHAASLLDAYMPTAKLDNADFNSADLTGARLGGASLVGTDLTNATLQGAMLAEATLTNAKLSLAVLTGGSLVNATLDNATLSNAKLDATYLQGADFSSVDDVDGMHLDNSVVSTMAGSWTYQGNDGSLTSYPYKATLMPPNAKAAQMTCPDTSYGPCTGTKLVPHTSVVYPPQPACNPGPPDYGNCP